MASTVVIRLPGTIGERLRREAERLGLAFDEYVVELLLGNLDPPERSREYIRAAVELLRQAREELKEGNIRQAAEKVWGATALAVKAYAYWRDGRRLTSHGELWKYKEVLVDELGEWVREAWYAGHSMHTCFYEGWCTIRDVEDSLKRIERLVSEVSKRILGRGS